MRSLIYGIVPAIVLWAVLALAAMWLFDRLRDYVSA